MPFLLPKSVGSRMGRRSTTHRSRYSGFCQFFHFNPIEVCLALFVNVVEVCSALFKDVVEVCSALFVNVVEVCSALFVNVKVCSALFVDVVEVGSTLSVAVFQGIAFADESSVGRGLVEVLQNFGRGRLFIAFLVFLLKLDTVADNNVRRLRNEAAETVIKWKKIKIKKRYLPWGTVKLPVFIIPCYLYFMLFIFLPSLGISMV